MNVSDKVTVLWLAFDGLVSREKLHREHVQVLFGFQDEIGSYFEKHLPNHHKIYGEAVISELRALTDKIFKTESPPAMTDLHTTLGKMVMVAGFIPAESQDV